MSACVDSVNTGLDAHQENLSRLCRLCGGRLATTKSAHSCNGYEDLFSISIDLFEDQANVHPPRMCHACYCQIVVANKPPTEKVYNWTRHPRVGTCDVCTLVVASSKGGRPKKAKKTVAKNLPKSKMEDASHTPQIPIIDSTKYALTIACTQCSQQLQISAMSQHTYIHSTPRPSVL